jgi:hypothetical protein
MQGRGTEVQRVHPRLRHGSAAASAALLLLAIGLAPAAHAETASGFRDRDYFAFADRIVLGLRIRWDERRAAYVSWEKGTAARTNANMLLLHAVAALRGHTGPARQDARARRLVEAMTRSPALSVMRVAQSETRAVCWSRDLDGRGRDHISLDSQIAEALAWAWTARYALGLSRTSAARIVRTIDGCARHAAWRFPHELKNQFNWNSQLYASAARVTGRRDLLRRDYRRHLARFAAAIARPQPRMRSSNLGRGYEFRYSPHLESDRPTNFDAPEYANIVASALQYYPAALRAGAKPLPARSLTLLRRWVTRLLAGSWTHAGYLNWDTGHGWHRWHSGQYWAFAQQGLLAIASTPHFWARREYGRWAKAMFDRGLQLYSRWATEAGGGIAPQLPFGVHSEHRDWDLYSTRMAANAARAIGLGLGSRRSADPPPMYAFDRDTGRLAVTTPHYSTAIVPDNRGAFPYGGIELARLFGPGQRVAANIGGEPPAAFGVVIRDAAGHEVLASQHAKVRRGRLRLRRRMSVGSFRSLLASGTIARAGLRITTTHHFRPATISERWQVRCRGACGPYTLDVQLPTWGTGAAIAAIRFDGTRVPMRPGSAIALADVERLVLGDGYTATPTARPPGAALVPVATSPQPTDTDPGPTLAIRLVANARVRSAGLVLRLEPLER